MALEERIAELESEHAALREQVTVLAERTHELEARLTKDSHNSGKPPSSDGVACKTTSLRWRSGRKPGGRIGHWGETLRLVATPDEIVPHRPAALSQLWLHCYQAANTNSCEQGTDCTRPRRTGKRKVS
jgi:hypothetical protein